MADSCDPDEWVPRRRSPAAIMFLAVTVPALFGVAYGLWNIRLGNDSFSTWLLLTLAVWSSSTCTALMILEGRRRG